MIKDAMPMNEKAAMSSMYLTLAQTGILSPESDRKWIRESLGLPDMEEGAVSPEWELEGTSESEDTMTDEQLPAEM